MPTKLPPKSGRPARADSQSHNPDHHNQRNHDETQNQKPRASQLKAARTTRSYFVYRYDPFKLFILQDIKEERNRRRIDGAICSAWIDRILQKSIFMAIWA